MLELSILDFVFIIFGAVALIIWMILFIKGNKYNSMFEVLSENEFRLKDIYGMGYAVLEMIGYNYKSKKRQKIKTGAGCIIWRKIFRVLFKSYSFTTDNDSIINFCNIVCIVWTHIRSTSVHYWFCDGRTYVLLFRNNDIKENIKAF